MPRRFVVWLVPTLLALHNAEEAIALRWYLPRVPALLPAPFVPLVARLSYTTLLETLSILSLVVFLLAFAVDRRPHSHTLLWLLLAIELAIGLNGLAHLLTAAFIFHGYGPGLVTGLAFNVPFAVYCFIRSQRESWLSPIALRATVPAALVLHGPVLIAGLWLAALLSR